MQRRLAFLHLQFFLHPFMHLHLHFIGSWMALEASGSLVHNGCHICVSDFCQPHSSGDGRLGSLLKSLPPTMPRLISDSFDVFTQGSLCWWNGVHSPASFCEGLFSCIIDICEFAGTILHLNHKSFNKRLASFNSFCSRSHAQLFECCSDIRIPLPCIPCSDFASPSK